MQSNKMKKLTLTLVAYLAVLAGLFAQETDTTGLAELKRMVEFEQKIPYKTGQVSLTDKVELKIPKGYKFIPKAQAETIIFDYWGNPSRTDILGMLVLENYQVIDPNSWAFILSEETEGYVKDEDVDKIDYDDMLKEMKEGETEVNKSRKEQGYGPIHTIGWAAKPYYDSQNKILHWAKELNFDNDKETPLTTTYAY
jgi:uncharacterized membrane-anchored protein